jgi:diguanylate cyclase (GGDEF)-like protein
VSRGLLTKKRRDDVVARFGGDEFVVLLRRVDEVIARRICRRIVDEVRLPLSLVDGPRYVSVSLGLAMDGAGGDLVEQADRAMLAAKRGGRARPATA